MCSPWPRLFFATLAVVALSIFPAFTPSELVGQRTDDRFTAMDVFNLEFAEDPQISPDGTQIVYVRRFADIMKDQQFSNLWIVNFDGTGNRPLTTGDFLDISPRWSPDGRRLLFLSTRDQSLQLYVRWMDSGETIRVTSLPFNPQAPSWSPDGEHIAFTSVVPAPGPQIADVAGPPPGAQWAPPIRAFDRLVHRFDGVGELEPGYSHIFVVPSTGGTPRQLSSGDFNHGGGGGRGTGTPVWSSDGRYVLISATRTSDWDLVDSTLWGYHDTDVYQFAMADGAVTRITDRRGPDNAPVVSPDGNHVAYLGFDDRFQGYQVTKLYLADRDGSNPRVLTSELDRSVAGPRWSADGRGLFFLYADRGNTKLAFVSTSGEVQKLADNVGGGGFAYGMAAMYTVSRDGRFAFNYTTPEIPGDIAVGSARGGDIRVVTAVNEDLLAQRTLGEVEEIWFQSSHDGRDIQGWIIKPPDFDPSKKYPLILEIHGGPFLDYGDRFSTEKQVMAGAGYVVLYTNPRGSTSYGEEFGNLIHHAYPGDDFFDLDSGVDAVIDQEYVDPDQLFVTGGSGGGVLSTWTIGRTDRYRAAVVFYPVINWYSFAVTSDIPVAVTKYWFPVPPWEDPEGYMERSTISLVGNVTTPTLLMTGENDFRTPMSETEQYYQALKLQGVEAVLLKAPGESHGIWGRPSHFMQKLSYLVGWFEKHKPQG